MINQNTLRLKTYKKSEWDKRRALITKLYVDKSLSVEELIAALAATKFYVKYVT